jgi:DNA-binding MarR family transcriptional regulator
MAPVAVPAGHVAVVPLHSSQPIEAPNPGAMNAAEGGPADNPELLELASTLHAPIIRLWRQLRSEAEPLKISALRVTLLFQIRAEPGTGVCALAARERMRPSTMNLHLRELGQAGLIARVERQNADRRRVGLVVTAAGHQVLEKVLERRRHLLIRRLAAMTEADRSALRAAVPVLARLSASGAGAVP